MFFFWFRGRTNSRKMKSLWTKSQQGGWHSDGQKLRLCVENEFRWRVWCEMIQESTRKNMSVYYAAYMQICIHSFSSFVLWWSFFKLSLCCHFLGASATSVYLYIIITCAWRGHCLHFPPFFMASCFILLDLSSWDFVHGTVPERVLSVWVLLGFCWWDFAWGDSARKDLFLLGLCLKGFWPWGFCGGFSHWECAWRNSDHRDFFTWIFHKSFSPLGLSFWDLPDGILSTRIVSSDILWTGLLSAGPLCPQILPCGILSDVILSVPCIIYMTCGLVNPSLDGAVCEQRWCTFCSREEREPFCCQPFHSSHPSQGCVAGEGWMRERERWWWVLLGTGTLSITVRTIIYCNRFCTILSFFVKGLD